MLDPTSGTVDAFTNPTGNLQSVYAAFRGERGLAEHHPRAPGFVEPDGRRRGQAPASRTSTSPRASRFTVTNQGPTPNGAKGRIVLAKPALTGDPRQDFMYQGWLYAAVVTTRRPPRRRVPDQGLRR